MRHGYVRAGFRTTVAAYLNSFDETQLATNFLASLPSGASQFQFMLPAGARLVLLVFERNPGSARPYVGQVGGLSPLATPTALQVTAFTAGYTRQSVRLRWSLSGGDAAIGFNLYRQTGTVFHRLNRSLIPRVARGTRSAHSSTYQRSYRGGQGRQAKYWLEAIALDGTRAWYGPAKQL
jgi:hypothetical protein